MLDSLSNFSDLPHYFVARNDWVLSHSPFIVDHTQITMADTTVLNINFYLMWLKWTWLILELTKLTFRLECCKGFNHDYSPFKMVRML